MPSQRAKYEPIARAAAERYGVDPNIFVRQITQESGWNPTIKSGAGATGIAQIMPNFHPSVNPLDPVASLDYAAKLMSNHLKNYGGDYSLALAAYNAGAGNVKKYGGVPPFQETQNYVKIILGGQGGSSSQGKPSQGPLQAGAQQQNLALAVPEVPFPFDQYADVGGLIPSDQVGIQSSPSVSPNNTVPLPNTTSTLPAVKQGLDISKSIPEDPGVFGNLVQGFKSVYDSDITPQGISGTIGQIGGVAAPAVVGGLLGGLPGAALGGAFGEISRGRNQDTREGRSANLVSDAVRGLTGATAAVPFLRGSNALSTIGKNALLGAGIGGVSSAAEQGITTGEVNVGDVLRDAAITGGLSGVLSGVFPAEAPRTVTRAAKPKEIPLLPGEVNGPKLLTGGIDEPKLLPKGETPLLPGRREVTTEGPRPGVLEVETQPRPKEQQLPDQGGVRLPEEAKTTPLNERPLQSIYDDPPNVKQGQILGETNTTDPVNVSGVNEVIPKRRANSRGKRLQEQLLLDPEEVIITTRGNEATITTQPRSVTPEIQTQLDQLRQEYVAARNQPGVDENALYRDFSTRKRQVLQGDSLDEVPGGLRGRELRQFQKERQLQLEQERVVAQQEIEDKTRAPQGSIQPEQPPTKTTEVPGIGENIERVGPGNRQTGNIDTTGQVGVRPDLGRRGPNSGGRGFELLERPEDFVGNGTVNNTPAYQGKIRGVQEAVSRNRGYPDNGLVLTYNYRGNRTSRPIKAIVTPLSFSKGKEGLALHGINENGHFVNHYLDKIDGTPKVAEGAQARYEGDVKNTGREKPVSTDDFKQERKQVKALNELLPENSPSKKALEQVSKAYSKRDIKISDLKQIRQQFDRIKRNDDIDNILRAIEDTTGPC